MKCIIDDVTFNYKEIFSDFGEIYALAGKEITKEHVKECDALIVRSRTRISQELLEHSSVKFIGSTVSGTDHVDLEYIQKCGLVFADAKGSNAPAVAEYVIASILNIAHQHHFDHTDKVLGIIGVGHVGTKLHALAKRLGMQVVLCDPFKQSTTDMSYQSLEYVLSQSDIISFHTPLTTWGNYPTYHLLASHNFHLVKQDAILINAARGGVIEEKAWIQHDGVKVVDCWENEPNINPALIEQAFLATPHIAGHSIDAKLAGSVMIYEALCKYIGTTPKEIKLQPTLHILPGNTLRERINAVYNYNNDHRALHNGEFEIYRREYPVRYEWHHYPNLV